MSQPSADKPTSEKEKYINKCLAKITRALLDDDKERRENGLRALSTAHPALARQLAERLVAKLERGSDEVLQRAGTALVVAGKFAVPAVALAAVKSRKSKVHLLAVHVLLAIGMELGESDRGPIIVTLIGLMYEDKEKAVREAAMNALLALRTP